MSNAATKNARMELKTTGALKQMLTKAATLSGLGTTAFVLSCAEEKARKVIEHHDSLSLSSTEQNAFLAILNNPSKSPEKLKELMALERFSER